MSDADRVREHNVRALQGNLAKEAEKLAQQNKLFVRDRLALLLDDDSFVEDGLLANALAGDLPADGPNRQHTCGTLPESRTSLAKMRPAPRRPGNNST